MERQPIDHNMYASEKDRYSLEKAQEEAVRFQVLLEELLKESKSNNPEIKRSNWEHACESADFLAHNEAKIFAMIRLKEDGANRRNDIEELLLNEKLDPIEKKFELKVNEGYYPWFSGKRKGDMDFDTRIEYKGKGFPRPVLDSDSERRLDDLNFAKEKGYRLDSIEEEKLDSKQKVLKTAGKLEKMGLPKEALVELKAFYDWLLDVDNVGRELDIMMRSGEITQDQYDTLKKHVASGKSVLSERIWNSGNDFVEYWALTEKAPSEIVKEWISPDYWEKPYISGGYREEYKNRIVGGK